MSIETWTAERIEQLRNFVVSGLTCSQIAAEIGVTRNAVIGKIHRLGLSPARPAGAPARSSPPRARSPRFAPQSRLFRLIDAQSPCIADAGAEPMPIDSAKRCSLLEIAPDKCHWPIGDPHAADFAFCGNAAIAGFSVLRGPRPHGLSRAGAAACLAIDRTAATPTSRCIAPIRRKSAFCRLAAAHSPAGFFLPAV